MENGTQAGLGALESGANTDQMGTVTPAGMAGPDDSQPSDMVTAVPGGASVFQQLQAKGSPFAARLSTIASKAMQGNAGAMGQPGVIPRLLVGSALEALGGNVGGMADAGAAMSEKTPPGAGALAGIARTLGARQERMRQQRKDYSEELTQQALRAETAVRTAGLVRQTYREDKDFRDRSYDRNKAFSAAAEKEGYAVQHQITNDQLMTMMKADKDFDQKYAVRPVAGDPVLDKNGQPKLDADGNPVESPNYDVISRVGPPHKLNDTESQFISNYTNTKLPPNTELSFDQWNHLQVQAETNYNTQNRMEKANGEKLSREKMLQLQGDLNDPGIASYMASGTGSGGPLAGLSTAKKNAEAHIAAMDQKMAAVGKVPTKDGQPNPAMGMLAAQRQKFVDELGKINRVIDNGFNDTAHNEYEKYLQEQSKEEETARHNKEDEANKREENRIKALEADGNVETLAPMLVEGDMAPTEMSKRSKTYNTQIAAANQYSMQHYGHPWDIAKADSDYKYASNVQTQNTLKYLNSLTGKQNDGGNLQKIIDMSGNINRTDFPALNDAEAWARLQAGDPAIGAYKTALTEVADQVAKILQGGGTGSGTSDAKLHQAQEMFNLGFSKKSINEIGTTLRDLLGNRKKEMVGDNVYLLKWMRQEGVDTNLFGPAQKLAPPAGAVGQPGLAADGKTKVWKTGDGQVKDSSGRVYDPKTGKPSEVK